MKRYRVRVLQTVIEEAWVTVEAETEEEALKRGPEASLDENVKFTFVECCGDLEALSATEVEP
jgi:hypothetical protein